MEIHLIRHGKTLANEMRLYCGRTDLPLSESGLAELMIYKSRDIYPTGAGCFFTSGLRRAEQTLDVLYGNVSRITVPNITEYDFGLFEMKSYDELKEQEDYLAWITDESGAVSCPGGESKNQVEKRVIEGYAFILEEVRQAGHGSALAVCHGGTIACIMEHLKPKVKTFYEWQPQPGRGYSLIYASGRFQKYVPI